MGHEHIVLSSFLHVTSSTYKNYSFAPLAEDQVSTEYCSIPSLFCWLNKKGCVILPYHLILYYNLLLTTEQEKTCATHKMSRLLIHF
uniref:Uncharacterized protein n=1 Tax=Rhizophora mucronata TaxID=61149 RepID=A0A2P2IT20_RHIMU